jgi:hypothetical protein
VDVEILDPITKQSNQSTQEFIDLIRKIMANVGGLQLSNVSNKSIEKIIY